MELAKAFPAMVARPDPRATGEDQGRRRAAGGSETARSAEVMRITISSPDGLGDFVLRMPFFEALRDAGHDLQIFMRPPALELAAAGLPAARIEKISEDPYARLVRFRRNPFALEVKKIVAFAPDLLVIALFQHSFF